MTDPTEAEIDGEYTRHNGTVTEWGVLYKWVTPYESEAEARRQLFFAQMDVPATLVKREVTEWKNADE